MNLLELIFRPHDDRFELIKMGPRDNIVQEPILNYKNRIIHVGDTINATKSESQPYSVMMRFTNVPLKITRSANKAKPEV